MLRVGLPDSFDVFHGLAWSSMHQAVQRFGELDLTVVSPEGHVLVLEVKAGDVFSEGGLLLKNYGHDKPKDIGYQLGRQHGALRQRLKTAQLSDVNVDAMLVLPDHHLQSEGLAYPRARIIDASQMPDFCSLVRDAFSHSSASPQRDAVLAFLSNQFRLVPDVGEHIGQVQSISTHLSSGLATWVPRIHQADQVYWIEATAGSGKTQLALKLLQDAAALQQRARYVCFNRPLADHLQTLAPSHAEVTTFHQLCRDHAERAGMALDFGTDSVFKDMEHRFVQAADTLPQLLDLLVIDESQDFDMAWVQALSAQLKPDGRLYVLGDSHQQLYEREPFELPHAVRMVCTDNFRSPQKVVHALNQLQLTAQRIEACSAHEGQTPGFHTHDDKAGSHDKALNHCLQDLWAAGFAPKQVVVLSFRGVKNSRVLAMSQLGGHSTRRTTGQFDAAGNALWHAGDLMVESVYRFKGQSAPVVVLCEVDFEELTPVHARKLFVGMTRGQVRVEVVLSERAAKLLAAALRPNS
jgi:thymidine kinase